MSSSLKILFMPVDAVGHTNACIGLAEVLRDHGHRIVFLINKSFEGKLKKFGFEEKVIADERKSSIENQAQYWTQMQIEMGNLSPLSSMEKIKRGARKRIYEHVVDTVIQNDDQIKSIVDEIKPDVIIIDHIIAYPSIIYSGVPWIWSYSPNPLWAIDDNRTPPHASGKIFSMQIL